jgi:hypothetical protein
LALRSTVPAAPADEAPEPPQPANAAANNSDSAVAGTALHANLTDVTP